MIGSMDDLAIDIEDLEFGWPGQPPLLRIDRLQIKRGERIFLMGPSGSGKSTLLGLISGILRPRRGSVRIIGTLINALPGTRADRFRGDHIGYIFQAFNLLPYLKVEANVTLPLEFSALRRQRLAGMTPQSEVQRLLMALGLAASDLSNRQVNRLSIGQQQRVAAARALIGGPELLIADEPTSALDADSRTGFLHLLMSECARLGTTVLFVSHDRGLAPIFDRTIELSQINQAIPETI